MATGFIGLDAGRVRDWAAPVKALALTVGSALVWALMAQSVLPSAAAIWPSREIAESFKAAAASCANPMLASAGYHEPSLIVLAGTKTRLTDGAGAANALLTGGPCAFAAVAEEEHAAFIAALGGRASALETLKTIDAVNYSKGRRLKISLARLGG